MTLGSLFDGAGTFPFAGSIFGVVPKWASEIEQFPIEVTKRRLPKMKHLGDIAGTLDASYWKGCGERNGTEREIIACLTKTKWIVRRVTPIECARLQGMPDWWCKDIKHADNAEYKMWGNGMALPCVMYVMQNLTAEYRKNLLRR